MHTVLKLALLKGVGGAPLPEKVTQFFDRLAAPPSDARAALYAAAIIATPDATWDKLDWLFVFAAADQGTALVNLKSASWPGIKAGAVANPTFTTDQGWNGTGTNYISPSGFNPSTAGGNYARDSAAIGVWSLGSAATTLSSLQNASGSAAISIYPRYTGDIAYYSVNSGNDNNTASADGKGLFIASRTSSTAVSLFRNKATLATVSKASTALVNDTISVAGSSRVIGLAFAASGFTTADRDALYDAWLPYMQAVAGFTP